MELDGRKARSKQFIRGEDGTLPRDKVRILEQWERVVGTLLTTKSSKLDPTISALSPQRRLPPSLGDEPTMDNMTAVIRGMPNRKAVGPDSLPAELLKLDHPEFIRYFTTTYLPTCGERVTSSSNGEMRPLRSFMKRRIVR